MGRLWIVSPVFEDVGHDFLIREGESGGCDLAGEDGLKGFGVSIPS